MKRRCEKTLAWGLLLVGICGPTCGAAPTPTPPEVASGERVGERLAELKRAIDAAIGEARADRIEQCRTIALGAKPCGGPRRYLVYSTATTDAARLETLVAEHAALDRRRNAEEGLVSDCMAVGPPSPALVGGRCVARTR